MLLKLYTAFSNYGVINSVIYGVNYGVIHAVTHVVINGVIHSV